MIDRGEMLKRCVLAVAARLKAARSDTLLQFVRDLEELLECGNVETDTVRTISPDLPVLRHWQTAAAGAAAIDAELGGALSALSSHFQWRQNPNYARNPPSKDFLDGYGYAVIAGSGGLMPAKIALGVLILAPGILYPAHAHPAEEVYLALDQTSRWWREGEGWRHGLAGVAIHHPPNLGHAMQAGSMPLCAVYLWRGAIEVNAAFIPDTGG